MQGLGEKKTRNGSKTLRNYTGSNGGVRNSNVFWVGNINAISIGAWIRSSYGEVGDGNTIAAWYTDMVSLAIYEV